ncbi:hypothetical protein GH714_003688 [Hevea brasiliensis]|uniref:Peroxin-7 n=1 Tax=Hevea brasiliensis TaxID=3981 RepID=A0A6A6LWF2_HEVBR|nr:hypothetical protein GH714_003688 [Hevea brasiliensis]
MPIFKTPFNGYSVKFSPFYESRLAVATAQNFGILGNGRVHVLALPPSPSLPLSELVAFDTADGVYDLAWSESHDSLLVAAVADGSVKLFDTALPPTQNPLRSLQEHTPKSTPLTTIPLGEIPSSLPLGMTPSSSGLSTVPLVYAHSKNTPIASTPLPGTLGTPMFLLPLPAIVRSEFDVREPGSTMIIPGHDFEILSCDWNKYDDCLIATASVDKSIRVWDVRSYRAPIAVLNGHGYAVRKVKFSPHHRNLMVSCSYDMTVCMWDFMVEDALVGRYDHHTEFAVGLDMSVLVEGLLASTGWDELVYVWQHGTDPEHLDGEVFSTCSSCISC